MCGCVIICIICIICIIIIIIIIISIPSPPTHYDYGDNTHHTPSTTINIMAPALAGAHCCARWCGRHDTAGLYGLDRLAADGNEMLPSDSLHCANCAPKGRHVPAKTNRQQPRHALDSV